MKNTFIYISLLSALPLYAQSGPPPIKISQVASSADSFVDGVGINTHLFYTNSIYVTNFPLVLQALQDLHVRHIRDGIHDFGPGGSFYYNNHNAMAAAGIRCDFIAGFDVNEAVVAAYPGRVQDMESVEPANEADNAGNSNWVSNLTAELGWLSPLANSLGLTSIGPSLVNASSYGALGNIGSYMNFNNLHNYFAGFPPETTGWGGCNSQGHCYGSIAWSLDNAAADAPGVPVWTTETGYDVNTSDNNSIPPAIYASYAPRLLLAQWNAGIKRTFIYELADDPSTPGAMGLIDSAGVRRPAFKAISSLLSLLQDPGGSFTPTNPSVYILSGATNNVQSTLLQKRDGTFYLALWIGAQAYNTNTKALTPISAQTVTVSLSNPPRSATLYSYASDWTLTTATAPISSGQITVSVTGNVSILKLR